MIKIVRFYYMDTTRAERENLVGVNIKNETNEKTKVSSGVAIFSAPGDAYAKANLLPIDKPYTSNEWRKIPTNSILRWPAIREYDPGMDTVFWWYIKLMKPGVYELNFYSFKIDQTWSVTDWKMIKIYVPDLKFKKFDFPTEFDKPEQRKPWNPIIHNEGDCGEDGVLGIALQMRSGPRGGYILVKRKGYDPAVVPTPPYFLVFPVLPDGRLRHCTDYQYSFEVWGSKPGEYLVFVEGMLTDKKANIIAGYDPRFVKITVKGVPAPPPAPPKPTPPTPTPPVPAPPKPLDIAKVLLASSPLIFVGGVAIANEAVKRIK